MAIVSPSRPDNQSMFWENAAYGYTARWYGGYTHLLHLRARWYAPESGTFLSVDPVESEPPYQYVGGNVVNRVDPSGLSPECQDAKCKIELMSGPAVGLDQAAHFTIVHTNETGEITFIEAFPSPGIDYFKEPLSGFQDLGNPTEWDSILHPYSTNSGILAASVSLQTRERVNALRSDPLHDFVLVDEGCGKLSCLVNWMKQVEDNEIGYKILGPNSTSAVVSVMRRCSLPVLGPIVELTYKRPQRTYPGWMLDILNPVANTRKENKELYQSLQTLVSFLTLNLK